MTILPPEDDIMTLELLKSLFFGGSLKEYPNQGAHCTFAAKVIKFSNSALISAFMKGLEPDSPVAQTESERQMDKIRRKEEKCQRRGADYTSALPSGTTWFDDGRYEEVTIPPTPTTLMKPDEKLAILTRRNSFSGIRYLDEPAIFAWEHINESHCVLNSSAPLLQAWITEIASYVKSMDQNHLVTIGLEGFYGHERTERLRVNPGDWAGALGSDFIQNRQLHILILLQSMHILIAGSLRQTWKRRSNTCIAGWLPM